VRLLLDDLKSGFTIDEFLSGCPTVSRELVEGYLKLAQDLVTECVVSWSTIRGPDWMLNDPDDRRKAHQEFRQQ